MKLTQQQTQTIIDNGKLKGLATSDIIDSLVKNGYEPEGVNVQAIQQKLQPKPVQTVGQDLKSDFLGIGKDIAESSQKRADNIQEIRGYMQSGEQGGVRSVLQTAGQLAGAGADAIGAGFKGVFNLDLSDSTEKALTEKLGEKAQQVMQIPEVQSIIQRYDALPEENKRDLEALGGVTALISEFIGVGAGTKAGKVAKKGFDAGVDATSRVISETVDVASDILPKTKDAIISFVSPNVDDSVKKVLNKIPTSKFDEVVAIAEKATDPTQPSVYEYVANSMTDATKQIDNQVKSLSQQKNTIINKAKTGLTDFSKETGQTILDINRKLKNSKVGNSFIERLKTVKTKIDADKAIDELQDILYKGNKDMTIPLGSSEDKTLKAILGKYNSNLKSSLPASYGKINTDISNRIKALNILNRSLGEVVDGVSTRGAGLVKQFFSPAGTKTKQLFEYIKKTTGVDLAEDAVLAKYVGEAFGDTKIKSLLEGVPTSKTGAIDKVIDFALEKTGANNAISKAKQKGMLKKARDITLPK